MRAKPCGDALAERRARLAARVLEAGRARLPVLVEHRIGGLDLLRRETLPAAEVDLAELGHELHGAAPCAISAALCHERRMGLAATSSNTSCVEARARPRASARVPPPRGSGRWRRAAARASSRPSRRGGSSRCGAAQTRDLRRRSRARGSPRPPECVNARRTLAKPLDSAPFIGGWTVRAFIALVMVLLLAGRLAARCAIRAEGEAPSLDAPEAVLVGRARARRSRSRSPTRRSGLRSLAVELVNGDERRTLLAEEYPGNLISGGTRSEHAASVALDPKALGAARERRRTCASPRATGRGAAGSRGNRTRAGSAAHRRPRAAPALGRHRPELCAARRLGRRGLLALGAHRRRTACAWASTSTAASRSPADRPASAWRCSPCRPTAARTSSRVVARDAAGNEAAACWPLVIKERDAADRRSVTLPPSFLDSRAAAARGRPGAPTARPPSTTSTRGCAPRTRQRIRELLAESRGRAALRRRARAVGQLPGDEPLRGAAHLLHRRASRSPRRRTTATTWRPRRPRRSPRRNVGPRGLRRRSRASTATAC